VLSLRFTMDGVTEAKKKLDRWAEYATDLHLPFTEIADDFRNTVETRQFSSQGSSSGIPWAALSLKYAAWKARHYPGHGIEDREGHLRRSLTSRHPFSIREIDRMTLRLGTRDRKARWQHSGTRRMPARPLIRITDSDRRRWIKYVQRYLHAMATGGV
jgi:phage gpG-like protein